MFDLLVKLTLQLCVYTGIYDLNFILHTLNLTKS